VASLRSCQKLPPCLIESVPAGSKMDLPLAKAKPISDGGSASGITQLRRGRKKLCRRNGRVERGVRQCERNNSEDTTVSEEAEVRRCLKCRSKELSLPARDEDHDEAGCSPALHGGPWWSRSPPVAVEGTASQSRYMPEGSCDPVGSPALEQTPARARRSMERGAHARAGLLAGLVTLWGPTLEQTVPEGLHPVEGTHAGACHEELHPMRRTHAGAVCEELQPVGRSHVGQV